MTRSLMLAGCLLLFACSKPKNVEEPKPDDTTALEAGDCDQEIALQCGEGMVDGCSNQLTLSHVCVPADETASVPCEQEIARECADGLTDGCLANPPVASTHVCVSLAAGPADGDEADDADDADDSSGDDTEPTP